MTTKQEQKFSKLHKISDKKGKVILRDMKHLRNWQGCSLGFTSKILSAMHRKEISKSCVYYWLKK